MTPDKEHIKSELYSIFRDTSPCRQPVEMADRIAELIVQIMTAGNPSRKKSAYTLKNRKSTVKGAAL